MKTLLVYILLIFTFFMTSCTTKAPSLSNPDKGVAVLPLEISNTSSSDIARYYKFACAESKNTIITIYPRMGQKFAFSEELSPGTYSITKVSAILDRSDNVLSPVNKSDTDINTIYIEIFPSSISVVDAKMLIEQYNTGVDQFITSWKIDMLTNDEKEQFIQELQELENSEEWKIVAN